MKKFKFDKKLQEAVLRRGIGQQPTVIINGEERKVRCPVFIRTDTSDISCLVEKNNKVGNAGCNVVAVSFDSLDAENKNWGCIQPMLIEQSIEFFIENHQMESMSEACRCASRLTDTRDSGFDLETEDAEIEIKVPLIVSNVKGTDSCIWKGFHQAVKQMIGYCNSSYAKEKGKRILLLIVCQHGIGHIQAMLDGKIKEELEKAVSMGIEFWTAETKTENDGISLMSYQKIIDNNFK